ncbi:MAG: hypothetical protein DHS20C08_21380 [Rhodomicrobium sp.]|nr:MAG: hypothetical protein DHS20C08_21380 [Rhodomicrobium sp.]
MTLLSGQKRGPFQSNSDHGGQEGVDDSASEELRGSSHLEDILGRIHELMAEADEGGPPPQNPAFHQSLDPAANRDTAGQRADVPAHYRAHPHTPTYETISPETTLRSDAYKAAAEEAGQAFLEATKQIAAGDDAGYSPTPPADMSAPYTEVLKEVRDYFKDRHSLDPADRLVNDVTPGLFSQEQPYSQKPRPDARQEGPDALPKGPGVPPKGSCVPPKGSGRATEAETPPLFSPIEFKSTLAPITASMEREQKAREEQAARQNDVPGLAERLSSRMREERGHEEVLFKGHHDLDRHNTGRRGTSFEPETGVSHEDLGAFRRELADRFSQLETVIGHHYGDRRELARDAARCAVEMTLKTLEDTPIGQRLAALEQAFGNFQERQDETNAKTGDVLARLSRYFAEGEALPRPESDGQRQPSTARGEPGGRHAAPPPFKGEPLQRELRDVGESGSQNELRKRAVPADEEVASPLGAYADEGEFSPGHASGNAPEFEPECGPGEAMVEAVPISEAGGSADSAVSDLEEIYVSGAGGGSETSAQSAGIYANRSDGKGSESERDAELYGRNAYPPRQSYRSEKSPVSSEEDYLTKSAALRAQFKKKKLTSRDDDMMDLERRGARPAIIVIVVALSLAAAGFAVRNNTDDLNGFLIGVKDQVNNFFTGETAPAELPALKGDLDTEPQGGEQGLILKRDGEEISITGNIEPRGIKNSTRLSDQGSAGERDFNPEAFLPADNGSLSLPPALIGPYSLRHAAANGDPAAQYEVARRFRLGQGVEADHKQAVRWFMHAAAQGFAPAQYRLGTYYERGQGVSRNVERAIIWYRRAAELGNVKAMHNLAVLSTARNQKKPDYATAIKWFREAAKRDLADSQFNLAILYQSGIGVHMNLVEAYKWYSLAARKGDRDAAKRRDSLANKLSKKQLLLAHNKLQGWSALAVNDSANSVGLKGRHVTSTMSHAEETAERSRVLTVQILLRKLGYDVSEADGRLNKETVAAIRKFEKDKGMPITGDATQGLIKVLNSVAL